MDVPITDIDKNLEWLEKTRTLTQRQILASAQILAERIRDFKSNSNSTSHS